MGLSHYTCSATYEHISLFSPLLGGAFFVFPFDSRFPYLSDKRSYFRVSTLGGHYWGNFQTSITTCSSPSTQVSCMLGTKPGYFLSSLWLPMTPLNLCSPSLAGGGLRRPIAGCSSATGSSRGCVTPPHLVPRLVGYGRIALQLLVGLVVLLSPPMRGSTCGQEINPIALRPRGGSQLHVNSPMLSEVSFRGGPLAVGAFSS